MKDGTPEILGAGSHKAYAKYEAEKQLKQKVKWLDEE
jgi:hypothetical protein